MKRSYILILLFVFVVLGFALSKDKSAEFKISGKALSQRLGGLKEIFYYSDEEMKTISFENSDFDIHGTPYWNNKNEDKFYMSFGRR